MIQNLEFMLEKLLNRIINKAIEKAFLKYSNQIQPKIQTTQDAILNIKEASQFLNLAIPTVYGLTSRKEIPYFKRGKKLYFKESDLVKWIESGRHKTKAEIETDAELYLTEKRIKNGNTI